MRNAIAQLRRIAAGALLAITIMASASPAQELRLATFAADASPPVGSPLAYVTTLGVTEPLSCRGIILAGKKTMVFCTIDWLGVANQSQDDFKKAIATAVGTTPDLVLLHALHQHDAPRADHTTADILQEMNAPNQHFDEKWIQQVVRGAAEAAQAATANMRPITHYGLGEGIIEQVASNRRIVGESGKVEFTRSSATKNAKVRAMPVGLIDPMCKSISFWNNDQPLAVLTYYATHPQSYYRTGWANPDFPGMARNARQKETGVFHLHFNGAGGNVTAGKWNDGAKENRQVLADKVTKGMKIAWEATEKFPLTADDVSLKSIDVLLPCALHLNEENLLALVNDEKASAFDRMKSASRLSWWRRCDRKEPIAVSCLSIGDARILFMPGELFVEYQLAAQKMRPDLFVAMAAYGEYGTGYIGTEVSYSQGGYETSPTASYVSPRVEQVLLSTISDLLQADDISK
ncbi:hypothetical protein [Blastopirellula marina]|uniref:Neutral/alkaline non-lysosomal ceramidase N-terminal domain-containing protein n=1 Tax=Blastopirellula marina DSM 3645 TaxID=314230 RepID=A3ZWG5_9BACT|nr:hypothetical protein [Blastopirellula marina]EAQ79193.1 hypothetical protein DSM3645_26259 [Blastopirellula marina DSM 3645]